MYSLVLHRSVLTPDLTFSKYWGQPLISGIWISRSASNIGHSPHFLVKKQNSQSCGEENEKRRRMWSLPFTFMEPSELDAFLFTVVASALFCLCCRYWALGTCHVFSPIDFCWNACWVCAVAWGDSWLFATESNLAAEPWKLSIP